MVGRSRKPMRCVRLIPREIVSRPKNMPVVVISRPIRPENMRTSAIKVKKMNDIVLV